MKQRGDSSGSPCRRGEGGEEEGKDALSGASGKSGHSPSHAIYYALKATQSFDVANMPRVSTVGRAVPCSLPRVCWRGGRGKGEGGRGGMGGGYTRSGSLGRGSRVGDEAFFGDK